jgi:hypothetical protein
MIESSNGWRSVFKSFKHNQLNIPSAVLTLEKGSNRIVHGKDDAKSIKNEEIPTSGNYFLESIGGHEVKRWRA